jgi:transposase
MAGACRRVVLLGRVTPRHYESDKTVHRGHISKEGDTLIRWAAVEAIQRQTEPAVKAVKDSQAAGDHTTHHTHGCGGDALFEFLH